ncbi:MAG: ATP synthase protein I [Alphaproteobacteria bacterium]|jgi:ATP synthase protein I
MTEPDKSSSLQDLDARLRKARTSADRTAGRSLPKGGSRNGLGFAMRLGAELVSALAIGVGIGLLLDYWLGTKPWFMLLFFMLGSVAGFMNVYRAATGMGQGVGYKPAPPEPAKGEDDRSDQAN